MKLCVDPIFVGSLVHGKVEHKTTVISVRHVKQRTDGSVDFTSEDGVSYAAEFSLNRNKMYFLTKSREKGVIRHA